MREREREGSVHGYSVTATGGNGGRKNLGADRETRMGDGGRYIKKEESGRSNEKTIRI